MKIAVLALMGIAARAATYTRQSCSSSQIFDTTTLSCVNCPTNMRPNPQQALATSCICNKGYYPTSVTSCAYLGSNASLLCASNEYFPVLADDGSYSAGASAYACQPCDGKARAN